MPYEIWKIAVGQWQSWRDTLFQTLHDNPKAPFVTRLVQFGSGPLLDNVLSHQDLAAQVQQAKSALLDLRIPVTVSKKAYGYQERGGVQDILDAIDLITVHICTAVLFTNSDNGRCSVANYAERNELVYPKWRWREDVF